MALKKSASSAHIKPEEGQRVCCFCGKTDDDELRYGKFYEHRGIITHYFCLLFSSNMAQKGRDNEGILGFLAEDIQMELRRGRRLNCTFCKKSGATLGCFITRCPKKFHLPCGLRNGSLHQFFGEFKSYCINHRPYQKIDERFKMQANAEKMLCYICYDDVDVSDKLETLWAPCCKKNAWFHRLCVQQLAQSAGYFFKCPLCNSKKEFQKAMLEYGIYIPCQDASWELVPNAYEELLYRHNMCDAEECFCPKGRSYRSNNAKWEIILCRFCGSQGIHIACGHLKWANPVWECSECTSIIRHSKTSPERSNIEKKEEPEDDSDSDSDISVGGVSSTLDDIKFEPAIRLKPGPRSFKLLQVEIAKSVSSRLSISESCSTRDRSTYVIDNKINESSEEETVNKMLDNESNKTSEKSTNSKSDKLIQEQKNAKEEPRKIAVKESNSKKMRMDKNKASTSTSRSKKAEEVIISSDEDDAIEIISETIVTPKKVTKDLETLKKVVKSSLRKQDISLPSTSSKLDAELIVQEDPGMCIRITTVTTIPQELHEKIPSSNNSEVVDLEGGSRRKRTTEEDNKQPSKKRRLTEKVISSIPLDETITTDDGLEISKVQLDQKTVVEEVILDDSQPLCILEQAIAGLVEVNKEAPNDADWQQNHTFLPVVNATDGVSNLSDNNIHALYMTEHSSTDQASDCDGDAGTGPAADPGPCTSTDTSAREYLDTTKFLDSQRSNLCLNTNSSSPTPSYYSSSSYSTNSSISSASNAHSDRSGLKQNIVCLNDIKFRLFGCNKLEITVEDRYKIDMPLDRYTLQSLRRARALKSERTAQDQTKECSQAENRPHLVDLLDDHKENLNPESSNSSDTFVPISETRTPFSPQNSEGYVSPAKVTQPPPPESGSAERKVPRCKVSIDLRKLTSLMNLLKKRDEPRPAESGENRGAEIGDAPAQGNADVR